MAQVGGAAPDTSSRAGAGPPVSVSGRTYDRCMTDGPLAPTVGWASGPLGVVQAADREIGRQTALRARAVAEFAATRPASADRPPGQPGSMSADRRAVRPEVLADVSEWAGQELVVALSITQ